MRCNAQENISEFRKKKKKAMTSAHAFVIYTRKKKKNPKNSREKRRKAFRAQIKSKVSRPFLFLLFAFGVFFSRLFSLFEQRKQSMVRREDQSFNQKKKEEVKRITKSHEWQMLPWYHISSLSDLTKLVGGGRGYFSGSAESHPRPHPKGPSLAASYEQGPVVDCSCRLTLYDMTQPVTMRGMFEK
jgi:hypothetical protein